MGEGAGIARWLLSRSPCEAGMDSGTPAPTIDNDLCLLFLRLFRQVYRTKWPVSSYRTAKVMMCATEEVESFFLSLSICL